MRSALAHPDHRGRSSEAASPERSRAAGAGDDGTVTELRRRLRSHPCHGCSDREDHARWAERYHRLRKEHDALVRRIEGRTSSIARLFDRVCDVLTATGHLEAADDGGLRVTEAGQGLRRLYAESDLLVAECLRAGAWDGLDAAGLAAAVSAVVMESRSEELEAVQVPGGPGGRLAHALDATQRVWSRLEDLEAARGVPVTRAPDLGLVGPVHRWASGRSLGPVLQGTDLAAGDFVRWCKQVIDLLDQLAGAAPSAAMRGTARRAVESLRRGVVAQSAV